MKATHPASAFASVAELVDAISPLIRRRLVVYIFETIVSKILTRG
jgi:hypothetical protein